MGPLQDFEARFKVKGGSLLGGTVGDRVEGLGFRGTVV